jgi:uncharacterized secreted protein with C-terminal beta-propeller domain
VRWFGDLGVVVTFRTTDPLYTIDLADPTRPRVAGELKIPGYSGYLHPVGAGMLLGVGQDADPRTGVSKGAQVSLFDLTDLADPRRVDQAPLGRGEVVAEHESRAFTYLPARATAMLPMFGESGSRLAAVRVDTVGQRLSVSAPRTSSADTERATPVGEVVATVGSRELRLIDPADGMRSLGVVAID